MLWTIIGIIFVLWLLGFLFDIAGNLVHVLLVIALIVFIFQMMAGRRKG
ncbi:lmo0937 family membrane protein [Lederbergia graminis]|uniref:Lmo0937 family membrane protein n=1 Tax=Lederbergia graminis TaxID=735518 RepID=A0ABW0LND1_9BACI|nr:lmo0937 family membrane protein [Paenibacillus bovis]